MISILDKRYSNIYKIKVANNKIVVFTANKKRLEDQLKESEEDITEGYSENYHMSISKDHPLKIYDRRKYDYEQRENNYICKLLLIGFLSKQLNSIQINDILDILDIDLYA